MREHIHNEFSDAGLFGRAARHFRGHRHGHGRPRGVWAAGSMFGAWPGEPRARRGDIKFAILEALAERPRHGYDVIAALAEARGGNRPSPGSVYPTLAMLEDEGHVTAENVDGKRVYTITDSGRALLAERPSDEHDDDEPGRATRSELKESFKRLAAAVFMSAREDDVSVRVKAILDRARREIYAILGEAE
jgi:DNA-binding PadR family transcriptional regulator